MRFLSVEQFEKAKQFVHEDGRMLDKAWLAYHFENGSKEEVIRGLEKHQNPDGGFGNQLEMDFLLDESSPMASTIAFQYLAAMNTPSSQPIIEKGITYFAETYEEERGRWTSVPKSVNEVPHAPWWHYDEEKGHTPVEEDWGNPVAEITGYFRLYDDLVPDHLVQSLTERCMQHFEGLTSLDMHETKCYLRLAKHLEQTDRDKIIAKVKHHLPKMVELIPEKWHDYGMPPLSVVDSPQSPFYDSLSGAIEQNLDFLIRQQTAEGNWNPNWTWGQYEEDWLKAKELWKSRLTVENLITLNQFGRIK